jgi:hypothetical protein
VLNGLTNNLIKNLLLNIGCQKPATTLLAEGRGIDDFVGKAQA